MLAQVQQRMTTASVASLHGLISERISGSVVICRQRRTETSSRSREMNCPICTGMAFLKVGDAIKTKMIPMWDESRLEKFTCLPMRRKS